MSRGFWTTIGAVAGFFAGGVLGEAIGMALFHNADGAGDTAAIGAVLGLVCGPAIVWSLSRRRTGR